MIVATLKNFHRKFFVIQPRENQKLFLVLTTCLYLLLFTFIDNKLDQPTNVTKTINKSNTTEIEQISKYSIYEFNFMQKKLP